MGPVICYCCLSPAGEAEACIHLETSHPLQVPCTSAQPWPDTLGSSTTQTLSIATASLGRGRCVWGSLEGMGSALMINQAPLLSKEDNRGKKMKKKMAHWLNRPLAVLTSSDRSTAPSQWISRFPFTSPAASHPDHAEALVPSAGF